MRPRMDDRTALDQEQRASEEHADHPRMATPGDEACPVHETQCIPSVRAAAQFALGLGDCFTPYALAGCFVLTYLGYASGLIRHLGPIGHAGRPGTRSNTGKDAIESLGPPLYTVA